MLCLQNTVEKYVASLYWSFSTITTVGYGDLTPTNTYERLFAIIAMVVGVTVFAYFMGSMTSVVSAMNESQQQYDKRMEEMEATPHPLKHIPLLAVLVIKGGGLSY